MNHWLCKHRRHVMWLSFLAMVWLFCSGQAQAGQLTERLGRFSDWTNHPQVEVASSGRLRLQ
ncbi:hypothetical protein XM38_042910 [Halomicronema hongdechloris C2206]|uniref:Uncharacterized protein n=2 Tax=Halomicronema hongdechloris TaxID=1209493 RepID=A0A1Z3HT72_9CYAN|nr:hypothetical protein XM38_042910 [Halomicronema hongdechloris C2206]